MWDIFISHAWEDKADVARPLAEMLTQAGLTVWYDEFTLKLGDNLRRSIEQGLTQSRFGIVILSPSFFAKEWPQRELDGLFAREIHSRKVILPVWHGIDHKDIVRHCPILADRVSIPTSRGLPAVLQEILRATEFAAAAEDSRINSAIADESADGGPFQQPSHSGSKAASDSIEQYDSEPVTRAIVNERDDEPETILGAWSSILCSGFNRRAGDAIIFECEVPVKIHLRPRIWRYRYPDEKSEVQTANRWRLEIVVAARQNYIRPQHMAVVAQRPHGSRWVQRATFRMYSKKEFEPTVISGLKQDEDPVDWLERNMMHDPWEKSRRYVAGIGFPNGSYGESRNTDGDFIFGACPDLDAIVTELLKTDEIKLMLYQTEQNKIVYWHQRAIRRAPRLYREVIDDATMLMWLSIQQALAGPLRGRKKWIGEPVSRLVRFIYCNHLNALNRAAARRHQHEVSDDDPGELASTDY